MSGRSRQAKTDLPLKNRVGGFRRSSPLRAGRFTPQPIETVSETSVTVTITVSGMSFWLSRDPIEEKGGLHLLMFVRNNSINFHDTLGLYTIEDFMRLYTALSKAESAARKPCPELAKKLSELIDKHLGSVDKVKDSIDEISKAIGNGQDMLKELGNLPSTPALDQFREHVSGILGKVDEATKIAGALSTRDTAEVILQIGAIYGGKLPGAGSWFEMYHKAYVEMKNAVANIAYSPSTDQSVNVITEMVEVPDCCLAEILYNKVKGTIQ